MPSCDLGVANATSQAACLVCPAYTACISLTLACCCRHYPILAPAATELVANVFLITLDASVSCWPLKRRQPTELGHSVLDSAKGFAQALLWTQPAARCFCHIARSTTERQQPPAHSGEGWGTSGLALDKVRSKVLLSTLQEPQETVSSYQLAIRRGLGYLRPCPGQGAQQGALANIGQAHEANVSQALQFQDEGSPLP